MNNKNKNKNKNKTFRLQKKQHKLLRQNSKSSIKSRKCKKNTSKSSRRRKIICGGNSNLTRVSSTTRKIKPQLSPPTMLQKVKRKFNKSVSFLKHAAFSGKVGIQLIKHHIDNKKKVMQKYTS
jgi:hypothetical protein